MRILLFITDQGPVSEKTRKLFGSVKPFLVHLYVWLYGPEKCEWQLTLVTDCHSCYRTTGTTVAKVDRETMKKKKRAFKK